jgi:hypothetical protein
MTTVSFQGKKDTPQTLTAFTITNWTSDVAMDCNAASDLEICDVLATVIAELVKLGILKGTVATA